MKKLILFLAVVFLLAVVIYRNVLPAQAAGNKNGVVVSQYYTEKGFADHDKWKAHLDWAKNLVGTGGYVKLFFPWIGDSDVPAETYKQVVQEVYARDLTPIVRVQGTWVKVPGKNGELNGCWKRPPQDSGTSYSSTSGRYGEYAQKIVDFVDSLPTPPQGKNLYIELWNEMNYDTVEWCDENGGTNVEPENYARFYLEVYNRMGRLGKPNIKLTNGGLGGRGDDNRMHSYLRRMLSEISKTVGENPSTLGSLFEYFSIHVYPANETDERFISHISAYNEQLNVFSEFGVDPQNLKVLVTEAGYIRRNEGTSSDQDARQAKLSVELAKKLSQDGRIVAFNFFSLDDYTDKDISNGQSLLETTFFVPGSSINNNGLPSQARPVYQELRAFMNPGAVDNSNVLRPIGYAVSEDGGAMGSISTPLVYVTSYPVTIDYTLKDQSAGLKVLYAKYFYSNGETKMAQTSFYYQPKQEQARVCTPGQTVTMCKRTQCTTNQTVTNPQDVLGVQVANACASGQTYYSCSDIKCPNGQVAPGGGCYPDNYTSDCLANCASAPAPVSASIPIVPDAAASPVSGGSCPDECYSDELRLAVGKNSSGRCDSGYQSSSYSCRAGSVGQRRVCGNTEYLCVDGNSSGFYWSQLESVPASTPTTTTGTHPDGCSRVDDAVQCLDDSQKREQANAGFNAVCYTKEGKLDKKVLVSENRCGKVVSGGTLGYSTTFRCNDQGTAWVCTGAVSSQSCTN